jgi:hypothetical protein
MDNNHKLIEADAIKAVKDRKTQWETSLAFITDKVAFNMREVIRTCRKNYWGVFDEPNDKLTGVEKIWHHLTKSFVDFIVKNTDLDTKDINFRAKHPNARGKTTLVRSITKNKLDEIYFGEKLDVSQRQLEIDGTIVWSTEEGEYDPKLIERIVITKPEFDKLAKKNKWINTDIEPSKNVSRHDPDAMTSESAEIKWVELYRFRGLESKYLLTGTEDDKEKEIPLEIICSSTEGAWVVHNIEKRKDNKKKGYEEAWANKVHGRWYGEGTAERLIQYQMEMNENKNIRRNRARTSQLGIFLIRKGAGITPQMLQKLTVNGALPVSNIEQDIKQLPMDEASESSYRDEELSYMWAQRITGAFDTTIGENLPSTSTATQAAIQNQGSQSGMRLRQEQFGMFLQRWLKNYGVPGILQNVTKGDLIRLELDPEELKAYDERQVDGLMVEQLQMMNANQMMVDPMQVILERERALQSLNRSGQDRFINLEEALDLMEYDVQVYITNEDIDKSVALQNLISMIPLAPEARQQLVEQAFDLMGLTYQKQPQLAPQDAMMMQGMGAAPAGAPAAAPTQNPQEVQTNAMTY